ncbi:hypothetical protein EON65_36990, partial [archaeon]
MEQGHFDSLAEFEESDQQSTYYDNDAAGLLHDIRHMLIADLSGVSTNGIRSITDGKAGAVIEERLNELESLLVDKERASVRYITFLVRENNIMKERLKKTDSSLLTEAARMLKTVERDRSCLEKKLRETAAQAALDICELQTQLNDQKAISQSLREQYLRSCNEISRLEQLNKELEQQCQQSHRYSNLPFSDKEEYQMTITQPQTSNSSFITVIENLEGHIASLESSMSTLAMEKADVTVELRSAVNDLSTLNASNLILSEEIANLKRQLVSLEGDNENKTENLDRFKEKNKALSEKVSSLESERSSLQGELARVHERLNETQSDLSEKVSSL